MIWRIRIGKWRLTFTIARVTDVIGVNSKLPDGKHILMWDFDDVPLKNVITALMDIQADYELPNIYIVNSGKPKHYMAYCFKRTDWRKAVQIVINTKHVDYAFIKYGLYREHFTLRVSPKNGRKIKHICTLPGFTEEDADIKELRSWVKYETLEDGQTVKIKEWRWK